MRPTRRCPIFLAQVVDPGCCDACNLPLPARRRRWCSDPCWQAYFRNHGWTAARNEALRRATVYVGDRPLWRPCDNCGRDTIEGRHGGIYGRPNALELAAEVNHVDPRVGQGYDEGCWNHQTNLQLLCHTCHATETARQASERAGATRRSDDLTVPLWGAAA